MWVQIPPFAPIYFALLAQLVEHLIGNEKVAGSNPVQGSGVWWNWFTRKIESLVRKDAGSTPAAPTNLRVRAGSRHTARS